MGGSGAARIAPTGRPSIIPRLIRIMPMNEPRARPRTCIKHQKRVTIKTGW
jgi:hypothetical protein